jgi:hypothetical protein
MKYFHLKDAIGFMIQASNVNNVKGLLDLFLLKEIKGFNERIITMCLDYFIRENKYNFISQIAVNLQ